MGRHEGRFEKLGLEAREGPVLVLEVMVVYGNNETERIDVHQHLREGERTPPIDLRGRDRAIKRIEVAARPGHGRDVRRHAVLDVYGEQAARENWELLGKQSVGFGVDHDTIRVGRHEGRFEKIALEVTDNDVEILDLKVFFRPGRRRTCSVREFIRAGARTRPLDLIGDDRVIDRIELVYRTRGPAAGMRPSRSTASRAPVVLRPDRLLGRLRDLRRARSGRSSAVRRSASAPIATSSRSDARKAVSAPSACACSATTCCS